MEDEDGLDTAVIVVIAVVAWLLLPITIIVALIWCISTGVKIGKEIVREEMEGHPLEEEERAGVQ